MEQNDQDIALDHLQRACSLRPGHILTLRLIGQVYRDIGLTDAALDTYRKIIESVQDDPGLLFDYASLLAESNRSGEAIAVYQRLIRSNPENVEALYNLGLVYNSEGLLDKAVECYRHVVARAVPGSPVHRLASEMVRPRRVSIEMAK
jgi:tetratricopeptide (TPR) repeat protein